MFSCGKYISITETMAVQNIVTVMGKKLGPGGVTSDELVDRCRTAARVMREVGGSLVIPTGGVTEAEAMREQLLEMGVEADNIAVETEARSTVQNAVYVLRIVKEKMEVTQAKIKLIIVTSAYHLPFTAWMFRQVAAALQLDIEMKSVEASGAGAYESSNINLFTNITKAMSDTSRLRRELQNHGIILNEEFSFEKIDYVVQELLYLAEKPTEQQNMTPIDLFHHWKHRQT